MEYAAAKLFDRKILPCDFAAVFSIRSGQCTLSLNTVRGLGLKVRELPGGAATQALSHVTDCTAQEEKQI